MSTTENSFDHWSRTFEHSSIEELIAHCVELGSPAPLAKLGALHEKFIDIAFFEKESPPNVRSIAASWIHALESVAIISFHDQPELLQAFMNARDVSLKHASEYGYGSPIFIASINGKEFMEQFFGGVETIESLQVKARRDYLLSSAFGRHDDSLNA